MRLIYSASIVEDSDYARLQGEHDTDVAIIGGGFTGMATAVALSERGYRVAVIEANRIGWARAG